MYLALCFYQTGLAWTDRPLGGDSTGPQSQPGWCPFTITWCVYFSPTSTSTHSDDHAISLMRSLQSNWNWERCILQVGSPEACSRTWGLWHQKQTNTLGARVTQEGHCHRDQCCPSLLHSCQIPETFSFLTALPPPWNFNALSILHVCLCYYAPLEVTWLL